MSSKKDLVSVFNRSPINRESIVEKVFEKILSTGFGKFKKGCTFAIPKFRRKTQKSLA